MQNEGSGKSGNEAAGSVGGATLNESTDNGAAVQEAVEAIAQLVPVIAKSGFKSSEFWLLVLAIAGQVALTLGNKLSGELASVLTMTGSGIYLFVRTYHKADAAERVAALLQGGVEK